MPADTNTVSALLHEVFLPGIREYFNQSRPLWKRIEAKTDKKDFEGSNFKFAANIGHGQGIGSPTEGDPVPEPGYENLVNLTLGMKSHYAVIGLSHRLMAQASSNRGAFANAVTLHVEGARDELTHDVAWNTVYGTGHGDLAQVSTYSGTTVTTKTQPTTVGAMGTRYIRRGMKVDSFTALSGGSQNADGVSVTNVTGSASTFTVAASSGFVAADYVFRKDSRGNVTMGLGGIVDDGTRVSTIQNLSRTTYPEAKANILGNSGTLRAWTPELMDDLMVEAWNNGNGKYPTAAYSPIEIQKRAVAYLRNDRRSPMDVMALDGGWKSLSWTCPDGNKPWIADQFCRTNEIIALHEPDLFFAILEDFTWEDKDGSRWRITNRVHEFEAWLYTDRNLGAYTFNSHSALRDISHTL